MARIDHINNPDAPQPNSVVPSAVVVIEDERGRVLLIRRSDNGNWALPGGGHDFGERIEDTAVRETREETGLDVEVVGLIGVYTNPHHLIEYSDGEVRQQFSLSFRVKVVGGEVTIDEESTAVGWFRPDETDALPMNEGMRLRVRHGFEHRLKPYLG